MLTQLPLDRTLVAYTSDHGDYAGHRGLMLEGAMDSLRGPRPCAARRRRRRSYPGRVVGGLVQAYDFVPTSCEAAGLQVDTASSTLRACGLIGRPGVAERERTGHRLRHDDRMAGGRFGTSKLIRHRLSGQTVLFDLADDPGETRNLVEDPMYRDRLFEVVLVLRWSLDRQHADLPLASPPPRM